MDREQSKGSRARDRIDFFASFTFLGVLAVRDYEYSTSVQLDMWKARLWKKYLLTISPISLCNPPPLSRWVGRSGTLHSLTPKQVIPAILYQLSPSGNGNALHQSKMTKSSQGNKFSIAALYACFIQLPPLRTPMDPPCMNARAHALEAYLRGFTGGHYHQDLPETRERELSCAASVTPVVRRPLPPPHTRHRGIHDQSESGLDWSRAIDDR
ncbi:hypothetical protein N7539_001278 [Penicillium diatomitis]|uniref:Uncharacterized protein n=1 Tax=Penicillium diatomitis TaxID=2819901 RepID=A0A9X0BZG7_9EURO|nr:uncharacterized protein N7539_001278 [Penicillium diatomitis]KAJ5492532.1 hypothetical protein N7539_001278 [Penicillium diatomitis]